MSGLPLHPMVVHLPLALAVFAPILMGILTWGVVRGKWRASTWWLAVLLQAIVFVSALTAANLGERDEEAVETIIAENVIEAHEEWGQKLVWASGLLLAASLVPFFFKKRAVPLAVVTAISLISLFVALKTGHSGGELVYRHGAAAAFSGGGTNLSPSSDQRRDQAGEEDYDN